MVVAVGLTSIATLVAANEPTTNTTLVVAAVVVISIVGIVVTWLGARHFERRLRTTIEELSVTQSDLRQLLDDLPDAVIGLDERGKINSANGKAAALTGRSVDDLIGRGFLSMIGEADRESVSDRWQRVDLGNRVPAVHAGVRSPGDLAVFELVDVNGEPHLVEASLHVSQSDQGNVVLLRDVSDRKRTTAALEQARRRLQQAFHSAPTGMALVRLDDGCIVDANQPLAQMLGRPLDDIRGQPIRMLTHPEDLASAARQRAQLELGIADSYALEQRYLRADGEYVWARTRVSVTEDQGVALAITHIEDITEQRRSAELLTHAGNTR